MTTTLNIGRIEAEQTVPLDLTAPKRRLDEGLHNYLPFCQHCFKDIFSRLTCKISNIGHGFTIFISKYSN